MNGEGVVGILGLIEEQPGDSSTAPPAHLTPRQVEVLGVDSRLEAVAAARSAS